MVSSIYIIYTFAYVICYILSHNGAVMLLQLMSPTFCRHEQPATLGAWWMKLLELCWCRCESFGSLLVVGPLVCSCNLGHGRPNMLDPMISPWIWVRDDGWESL